MGWPIVDFEPVRIHAQNLDSNNILVIGVDGQLAWVDANTLEQKSLTKSPFPARIIISSASGSQLISCWLNRDLLISRMASIDLNNDFQGGLSQHELRNIANTSGIEPQVKGATWSHTLDAECLAIESNENGIIFALWNRGIYRVNLDSSEVWRKPPLNWTKLGSIEEAKIPAQITVIGDEIHIWSRAGEKAVLEWDTGELKDFKTAEFDISVDKIFYGGKSNNSRRHWLLISNDRTAHWLTETEDETSRVSAEIRGPVNDAKFDIQTESWRMAGWREDILWNKAKITYEDTLELGIALYNLSGKWMVLNNKGEWIPFSLKIDQQNHSSSDEEE